MDAASEKPAATVAPRTVQAIIDEAIAEGRKRELLCNFFVCLFVLVGIGVLIGGAIRGDGLVALSGTICTGFFWPSLRYAEGVRRSIVRIRMYEMALTQVKGAKAITDLLEKALSLPEMEK